MSQSSGDDIKSAFEKAMERVDQLEPPAAEKKLEWRLVPEGNRIAGEHMRGQGDMGTALDQFSGAERSYVLRGIVDVLTANIQLAKHETAQATTDKALDGLIAALQDNTKVPEVVERVKYVNEQYRTYGAQQLQQMFEQLKQQFAGKMQEAMRQQTGMMHQPDQINVEAVPEFQQEWLRTKVRLDQQYEEHLDTFRQELKALI
ncbi:hypothetical protein M1O29_03200 [Dehalococcoidia bacterium]|nr:hypothetical protein [Dehalococcoidia bacterium]